MSPFLQGEAFSPQEQSRASHDGLSPSPVHLSAPDGHSRTGRRASQTPFRASSLCATGDGASSAAPSYLPSLASSRPVTAADGAVSQNPWRQHHQGADPQNAPEPLFLSAVVHSGTTTVAGLPPSAPTSASWRTGSGFSHVSESGAALGSGPPEAAGDPKGRPSAPVPPLSPATATTTTATDVLTAAAARLHRNASPEPRCQVQQDKNNNCNSSKKNSNSNSRNSNSKQQQQQQSQLQQHHNPQQQPQQPQKQQQHVRPLEVVLFRAPPPPPAPPAGSISQLPPALGAPSSETSPNEGDPSRIPLVPWDAGRPLQGPAVPGTGSSGGDCGLLPYTDVMGVKRQLGNRRVPAVVLEPAGRRLLASRETNTPMTPSSGGGGRRSPTKAGCDGLATPQRHSHPAQGPGFSLAPRLQSPFAAGPSAATAAALRGGDADALADGSPPSAASGRASPTPEPHGKERQLYSATTISFTRPGSVAFQPITRYPSPTKPSAPAPSSASAPLPSAGPSSPPAPPAAATPPLSPQRSRTSFPPWGHHRATHGSSPPRPDTESSEQGLGLWSSGAVPVRVTTFTPMMGAERASAPPKAGMTHTQHTRLSAVATAAATAGAGGHAAGPGLAAAAALTARNSVDLTGSLRRDPQFQLFLQQQRQLRQEQRRQQQAPSYWSPRQEQQGSQLQQTPDSPSLQQEQPPHHEHHHHYQQQQHPAPQRSMDHPQQSSPPPPQPSQPQQQPPKLPLPLQQQPSLNRLTPILMPGTPRFTPLPHNSPGPTLGSPPACNGPFRPPAGSFGGNSTAESRPSTAPSSPHYRSSVRSPRRSPPRSPGRQSQSGVAAAGTGPQAPPATPSLSIVAVATTDPMPPATAEVVIKSPPQRNRHRNQPQLQPQLQQRREDAVPQRRPDADVYGSGRGGSSGKWPFDVQPPAATISHATVTSANNRQEAANGGGGSANGEARRFLDGSAASLASPQPGLRMPLPYSAADTPILTAAGHCPSRVSYTASMHGAGPAAAPRDRLAAQSPVRRSAAPAGLRPASKEGSGLMLLNVHAHQEYKQQQLQQHQLQLQERLQQQLEAELVARTFSLRQTVYKDWVKGTPTADHRRGGSGSGGGGSSGGGSGGVVAGGLEGKAVTALRRQPLECASPLFYKAAQPKPLLAKDVLQLL